MNDIIIDSLAVEEYLIKVISQHLSTAGGKRTDFDRAFPKCLAKPILIDQTGCCS